MSAQFTHSFLYVPENAPAAYWEGYFHEVGSVKRPPARVTFSPAILLASKRTHDDGRSDARFVADRLASGLYPSVVVVDVADTERLPHLPAMGATVRYELADGSTIVGTYEGNADAVGEPDCTIWIHDAEDDEGRHYPVVEGCDLRRVEVLD